MVIFHCYVKLPEGIPIFRHNYLHILHHILGEISDSYLIIPYDPYINHQKTRQKLSKSLLLSHIIPYYPILSLYHIFISKSPIPRNSSHLPGELTQAPPRNQSCSSSAQRENQLGRVCLCALGIELIVSWVKVNGLVSGKIWPQN